MGRRREKNAQRFFYDGYLQIADNRGNIYAWDCTEIVATRPLFWNDSTSQHSTSRLFFYTHDCNKNVSEFLGVNGSIDAHYEYTPFGGVAMQMRGVGWSALSFVPLNPWRFSSEYLDDELQMVYYNWRHYSQNEGRWVSRDFLDDVERSYAYLENKPVHYIDALGLLAVIVQVDKDLKGIKDVSSDKFARTRQSVDSFIAKAESVPTGTKLLLNGKKYTKTLEEFKKLAQREKNSQYVLVGSKNNSLTTIGDAKAKITESYDYLAFAAHATTQGFDGTGDIVIEFSDGRYNQKKVISEILKKASGSKGTTLAISCYQTWDRKGKKPRHEEGMILYHFGWKYTPPSENICGELSMNTVKVERKVYP
jgi:RHS repeat-associated protein